MNAVARELMITKAQAVEKLNVMRRHEHIRMEKVPERWSTGHITLTNKIWITNEGRAWLKENAP